MKKMFVSIIIGSFLASGCGIVSGGFFLSSVRDQYEHPANVGVQSRSISKPPAYYVSDVDLVTGVYAGPFVRLRSANGEFHVYAWHGDHYVRYQDEGAKWTFRGD